MYYYILCQPPPKIFWLLCILEHPNVHHLIEIVFQTQKNGWDGPGLGVKQATENKRQFDDEVAFSLFILFQMIFM